MTATRSAENKALTPSEDKTSAGALAPVAVDGPKDLEALRASDVESLEVGKIRVQFVHHVGDKKPGNHATLDADEANALIAARVAVLDPKD
jgi:hypothetical protein